MSLIQSKNQYFEKVIRDKEGRLVRATFYIYEIGGRIKARLVDFKYIGEIAGKIATIFGIYKKESKTKEGETFTRTSSPFFSFGTLHFSGSKPRAPTI